MSSWSARWMPTGTPRPGTSRPRRTRPDATFSALTPFSPNPVITSLTVVGLDHDHAARCPDRPTSDRLDSTLLASRLRRSRTMLSSRLAMFSGSEATSAARVTRVAPRSSSDSRPSVGHGSMVDGKAAAAGRVEPVRLQARVHRRAHPAKDRQKRPRQEIERRRIRVVRAALEREPRRLAREQQRRQHRLEDERRAAGGAHRQAILAAAHLRRLERSASCEPSSAPETRAPLTCAAACTAVRCCRSSPASPRPARIPLDAKRPAGDERERERGAQDLPAAFALGAVDRDPVRSSRVAILSPDRRRQTCETS